MSAFRPSDPKPSRREPVDPTGARGPSHDRKVGVYDRPGGGRSWNTFTKVIVILMAILIAILLYMWIL